MNSVQIFNNSQFGQIRVATTESNDPLFCLNDLCRALNIANSRNVRTRLDEGDVRLMDTPTESGTQSMTYVTEPGMYTVILRSDSPLAKPMQKWVTSEVLPTIRKHGAYMSQQKIEEILSNPDTIIKLATTLKEEQQKRTEAEQRAQILDEQNQLHQQVIKESAPKVQYYNDVLSSKSTYTTTQIAKEFGIGGVTLNRKLRDMGVQYSLNGQWLLYAKHQNKGYTETRTHVYLDELGEQKTSMTTVWTEKGREFIHKLLTD